MIQIRRPVSVSSWWKTGFRKHAAPAAAFLTIALLISVGTRPASAQTIQCTSPSGSSWIDGNGTWSTPGNWNNGVPDASTNACIIDGTSTVTLDTSEDVASLQLAKGNTLNISPGQTLTVHGGSIINQGAITIDATPGNNANFNIANGGSTSLTGGGTVTLSSSGSGTASIAGSGSTLTNVDNTIEGTGNIALTLINEGKIEATSGTLTLSANTTNTGTLEATSGGTLNIQSSVANLNGLIQSSSGSSVNIGNGATISGGTLDSGATLDSTGGTMGSSGTVTLNGASSNGPLTIKGTFNINNSNQVNISGSIINQGTIDITAGNSNTFLAVSNPSNNATATLTGGGKVVLSSSGSGTATIAGFGGALTNVDNTIEGSGNVGNSGQLTLTNRGTIDAGGIISGGTLTLQTNGDTNTGLLTATNGGTLNIRSSVINLNGLIQSSSGSSVNIGNGATISGGTLDGSNGSLGTNGSITLDGNADGALTLKGTFNVNDSNTANIVGAIQNQGTIKVIDTGDGASLSLSGDATLSGGGTVTLGGSGGNATLNAAGQTLTNIDNVIQGAGTIEGMSVFNHGTIDANVAGGTLSITANAFTNTNILEATGGGTLSIQSNIDNSGGTISSSSGSSVLIGNSATIYGGTLNSNGGMLGSSGTATLDGGTSNGPLTIAGTFTVNDGNTVGLNPGTIINQGTIAIDAVSAGTVFNINSGGPVTLTGGGIVMLSSTRNGEADLDGFGGTLTKVNNTIEGNGVIGGNANGHLALSNQGIIDANVASGALTLNTASDTNTGTLEATNGGTLALLNTINNQNGTILASGTGSSVLLNGNNATIQGGTLNTANGGTMGSAGGVSVTLDGSAHGAITNVGTFTVANNSTVNITGTIVNQGTIAIDAVSAGTVFNVEQNATATLTGGGLVVLSSSLSNGSAEADFDGFGGTLTNVNNTIEGNGVIGGNANGHLALSNQGTIDANVASGTLILQTASTQTRTPRGERRRQALHPNDHQQPQWHDRSQFAW